MIIIGIDPGSLGGVAVLKYPSIETHNMPETYPDIYNLFVSILEKHKGENILAVLEDVGHGMPGQSSKATAVFARHNGHLEMALYALGVRTIKVTPQKWQKHYSNSLGKSSGCEKTVWKNKLKGLAQQMFPTEKVTLKTADAMLIACYGADLNGQPATRAKTNPLIESGTAKAAPVAPVEADKKPKKKQKKDAFEAPGLFD